MDAIAVEIKPTSNQEQQPVEVYFLLPELTGDQTYSYNQNLTFDLGSLVINTVF